MNGGPSGVGIATAAGKAAFWDVVGAPESPKVIALEGEFALTEGHAQELKTQALALQVGKRLRVMVSDNNAGIDDCLIGGTIGGVIAAVLRRLRSRESVDVVWMERLHAGERQRLRRSDRGAEGHGRSGPAGPPSHRRDRQNHQGLLARGCRRKDSRLRGDQLVSYASHPYALKMNSEYFLALAQTFEKHYGVEFEGIRKGPVTDNRERLIQFKTNIDVVMSLLDRNGLGDWLADRLVEIGDTVRDDVKLRISATSDPFLDDRLRVAKLPEEPQKVSIHNRDLRRGEASQHRAVQEAGRGGRSAPRDLRNHQVDELRHGRTILHAWPPTFRSRSTWSTAACGDTTVPRTIRWARA